VDYFLFGIDHLGRVESLGDKAGKTFKLGFHVFDILIPSASN